MISRQFLLSTQTASAERRAEAAAALARAYLHGSLAPEAAWEAKTTLLALLDDGSALVRRALAEACASSAAAPRPLIVALASDQPEIACLVLARSPVLMDADLVDCAAIGCETTRSAIAGRADISRPVAAALAEVAGSDSLTVLARNAHAAIGTAALLRMIERHGHEAPLREALLARTDLGIEVRHALAASVAQALSSFGLACGWLNRERGERVTREARDCAALSLGDEAGEVGLARLVSHLRAQGQLNAGLILRAILSLRMPFAEAALADLSGLSRARVAGLMFEPRGAGFAALHRRAGLPPLLLPAIQAALSAWREAATGGAEIEGPRLARRMIERALTACETMPFAESRALMALLARFEAEAAREEAREHTRALAFEAEQAEILRIEAGQRQALASLPEAVPATVRSRTTEVGEAKVSEADVLEPVTLEPVALEPAAPDRLSLVLDELPGAILASYRAAAAEREAATVSAEPPDADRLSRVLGELPDAVAASYRAEQERRAGEAAGAVLDGLSDALMSSFLAGRAMSPTSGPEIPVAPAPGVVPEVVPETRQGPVLVSDTTSAFDPNGFLTPHAVDTLFADLIPESVIASHRGDRERARIAA